MHITASAISLNVDDVTASAIKYSTRSTSVEP
jgi:hypothetical protein